MSSADGADAEPIVRPERSKVRGDTLDDLAQEAQRRKLRKLCTQENCVKSAVSKGLCSAHGGGARCMVENCNKLVTRKGYCGAHATEYGYASEGKDRRRGRYQRRICKHSGCENMEYGNSKGYCTLHGGGPKKCNAVGGCTRVAIFQGMCLRHANAARGSKDNATIGVSQDSGSAIYENSGEHGSEVKPKKVRTHVKRCKVDECEKHVVIVGFCMTHAREYSHMIPERYRCQHRNHPDGSVCGTVCIRNQRCYKHGEHMRCRVQSCGKHAVFRGYCKAHGKIHEPTPDTGPPISFMLGN